jgi:hypothetical protein
MFVPRCGGPSDAPDEASAESPDHVYVVLPDFWPEGLDSLDMVTNDTTATTYMLPYGVAEPILPTSPPAQAMVDYGSITPTFVVPTIGSFTGDPADAWSPGVLTRCLGGYYVDWAFDTGHDEYRRQMLASRIARDACGNVGAAVTVQ